jgi:hypothetical protein
MSAEVAATWMTCAAGDEIEPGEQFIQVNDRPVHVDCESIVLRLDETPPGVRLEVATKVATYWHAAAVKELGGPLESRYAVAGHALSCVLSALAGETDPGRLGVEPEVLA